jgi:hypothetical protein
MSLVHAQLQMMRLHIGLGAQSFRTVINMFPISNFLDEIITLLIRVMIWRYTLGQVLKQLFVAPLLIQTKMNGPLITVIAQYMLIESSLTEGISMKKYQYVA